MTWCFLTRVFNTLFCYFHNLSWQNCQLTIRRRLVYHFRCPCIKIIRKTFTTILQWIFLFDLLWLNWPSWSIVSKSDICTIKHTSFFQFSLTLWIMGLIRCYLWYTWPIIKILTVQSRLALLKIVIVDFRKISLSIGSFQLLIFGKVDLLKGVFLLEVWFCLSLLLYWRRWLRPVLILWLFLLLNFFFLSLVAFRQIIFKSIGWIFLNLLAFLLLFNFPLIKLPPLTFDLIPVFVKTKKLTLILNKFLLKTFISSQLPSSIHHKHFILLFISNISDNKILNNLVCRYSERLSFRNIKPPHIDSYLTIYVPPVDQVQNSPVM